MEMRNLDFFVLKCFCLLYLEAFQECNVSGSNMVSTSGTISVQVSHYPDTRLVVPGNLFSPRLIPKGTSIFGARVDCTRSCAIQENCHAFNVYDNQSSYVCELLSDNLSRNKTVLQFLRHPGSTVWEKQSTGLPTPSLQMTNSPTTSNGSSTTQMKTSQPMTTAPGMQTGTPKTTSLTVTTKSSTALAIASSNKMTPILCENIRPGCLGTFPNCINCTRTCIDWFNRRLPPINAKLWPDGDGPDSVPVNAMCDADSVILVQRNIDLATPLVKADFVMPIWDMHRLVKLQAYRFIKFEFFSRSSPLVGAMPDKSQYSNVFIGPDGTLANLTYYSLNTTDSIDVFNLGGKPMPPTPFVNVTDDRYSCGSFWLLDRNNATYCPGGKLGIFGTYVASGKQVISTGMRTPSRPDSITMFVKVTLRLA